LQLTFNLLGATHERRFEEGMEKKSLRGHMTFWRLLFFGADSMNQDRAKRKLTAIFSADVVGYSRLDEKITNFGV